MEENMQYTIKKVAKQLTNIEKHPVFEIAENSPIYILNGMVYSEENNRIVEIDEFSNLDSIANERNQFFIEKIKEKYARQVKKKITNKKEEKEMTIQQLVYTKVFLYLREDKYDNKLEDLINKDEKDRPKSAQENEKIDKSVLKHLKKVNKIIEKIESEAYEKLTEENLAIIDGKIYKIKEMEENNNADLSIGEKHYNLIKTLKTTKDLEEKYLMELSKQTMLDVLKKEFSQDKLEQMLKKEDRMLKKIANKKKYEEREYGFIVNENEDLCDFLDIYNDPYEKDNAIYTYIKVPAFAVKSQYDDNYYLFKKTKIGFIVYCNDENKLLYDDNFLLMGNNNHPFLNQNDDCDVEYICTGRNEFPTSGKDKGDVIAKRLKKARDFLMYALSSSDKVERPCYELTKYCRSCQMDHYRKNRISLEKLKKMNVTIISRDSFVKNHSL